MDNDEWVGNQLKLWGLEELYPKFKDEGIDKETLLTMPSEAVKELIPKLGPRYKFLKKRYEFTQNDNDFGSVASTLSVNSTADELDDASSACGNTLQPDIFSENSDSSVSSTRSTQATGQKLKQLLKKSVTGQSLLENIQLTPTDRKKLCDIIIEHLLNNTSLKIPTSTFQFWAAEIERLFRYERKATYFVPYQGGTDKRAASGKLWDKYANTKRYLKKNILKSDQKVSQIEAKDNEKYLLQLRTVSPEDIDLARTLWEQTHGMREKTLSIATYYQEYPILASPIGSSLLQLDFQLSNVCSDPEGFLKKWPDLSAIVVEIAKTKRVPLLDHEVDIPVEVLGLLKLPYLFRPSLVKTGNSKKWKPSTQEQTEGFICSIAVMADLETAMVRRKEKLLAYGLTCQPLVVAVGEPKNYDAIYVIVNEVKYTASNLMGAIDLCFKIHYALSAKYSAEAEIVWVFLQKFIYGIEGSKHFVTAETVWSDIQKLKEQNIVDV